ncbi:hypothetical protein TUM4636_14690 [Shewanella glacialipiscicola]|nr:hypothetical protein TUM4636_14690 [Shewanella glacialipiscicola]
MSTKNIQTLLDILYQGNSLSREQTAELFGALIRGEMSETAMAGMLVALKMRGETIDEISGAADAMRAAAKYFPCPEFNTAQANNQTQANGTLNNGIIDIVGTGGDGFNTINISTTAAFVAAAAGAKVAKHGNRSVSSKSGSSDLLAQFGIDLTMSPDTASRCLEALNLCFLFAPHYHGGVKHAVPVRQALKTRTLFNVLGPLINPARPEFMLLGVYSPELVLPIAKVLKALGTKRAMVVHGSGLDEVALHGNTQVAELKDGDIIEYQLTPADLGVPLAHITDLEGGEPAQNALITEAILKGRGTDAHTNAVAINAGCALYICGIADSVKAGTLLALATIQSGKAFELLSQLAKVSSETKENAVMNPEFKADIQDVRMPSSLDTVQKGNVLTRIVDTKAAHIAALKLRFPEASLSPKVSDRSLFDALKTPKAGYILECKKASPSKGLIRDVFDVEAIADIYGKYAAGISVLTDEQFFQGDMDYIPKVRARVSQPILCKDFFIDEYQIKLAAHQGADAILLMLSVLDDEQYQRLAKEAAKYQLDVLTEVSNEEELKRAIVLDAPIIGINNRNLRDLSTDLATTEALAPHIGSDRVVISESGIYNNEQVRRLSPLVDGFLVGSSIMAEADIDLACRKLIFGHNKVCGLTRVEDIRAAATSGAVYAGLIFAEQSPRALTLNHAEQLLSEYHASDAPAIEFVGVFVNATPSTICDIATRLQLSAVQLHGAETELEIAELAEHLQHAGLTTQIWKAVSVDAKTGEIGLLPKGAQRYLFDSKTASQFGGSGKAFNWQSNIPQKSHAMLAGGLNADNATSANTQGFYGLDFNSGLETTAGIKSAQLIQTAFTHLRL